MKRRNRAYRLLRLTAVYLLLLPFLLLGWLYSRLPDRVYLEPGQALLLPRFGWVEPMGLHGSQNAASTQVVGSYQTTLSLGGWLPIKNIRTVVTERTQVTVCGTPFGVKMFSEGALIVGFSDIDSPGGSTVNPAKAAGLRLGDRVICIGQIRTENNDAVKEALEAARGSAAEVIYVRSGEQRSTTLTPVWDAAAAQWRAGMWVRDSSAGVGTLTFVDPEKGVFAGLGHPISDGDTGESIALRSGEIVPCEITGCSMGTVGSPGEVLERPRHWQHPDQWRKRCLWHNTDRLFRANHAGGVCAGGRDGRCTDPGYRRRGNATYLPCPHREDQRCRSAPQYGRPGGGQSPAFPDRRHCAGDERQSHFAEWAAGRRGDPCSRQRSDTRLRDFCADHAGAG